MADLAGGVEQRRRDRQLRSWLRPRADVRSDGSGGGSTLQLRCGADCCARSPTETEDRQCQRGGRARAALRLTRTEAPSFGNAAGSLGGAGARRHRGTLVPGLGRAALAGAVDAVVLR